VPREPKIVTQIFTFTPDLFDINRKKTFVGSLEAIAEDSSHHHGIPNKFSNNVNFSITCTSKGGK
jgi:hypothetical protein